MSLVLKPLVHHGAQDPDVIFGCGHLSLDGKRLMIRFTRLGAKWMMAVFIASKVAPLLLSQSSASLIIASIPFRLLCAVNSVTHAVKSPTDAIAPP